MNKPPLVPQPKNYNRKPQQSTSARGYNTQHQKLRKIVLAEQKNICGCCNEFFAVELHHIDRNTHNTQRQNLVGLCQRCHHNIHRGQ